MEINDVPHPDDMLCSNDNDIEEEITQGRLFTYHGNICLPVKTEPSTIPLETSEIEETENHCTNQGDNGVMFKLNPETRTVKQNTIELRGFELGMETGPIEEDNSVVLPKVKLEPGPQGDMLFQQPSSVVKNNECDIVKQDINNFTDSCEYKRPAQGLPFPTGESHFLQQECHEHFPGSNISPCVMPNVLYYNSVHVGHSVKSEDTETTQHTTTDGDHVSGRIVGQGSEYVDQNLEAPVIGCVSSTARDTQHLQKGNAEYYREVPGIRTSHSPDQNPPPKKTWIQRKTSVLVNRAKQIKRKSAGVQGIEFLSYRQKQPRIDTCRTTCASESDNRFLSSPSPKDVETVLINHVPSVSSLSSDLPALPGPPSLPAPSSPNTLTSEFVDDDLNCRGCSLDSQHTLKGLFNRFDELAAWISRMEGKLDAVLLKPQTFATVSTQTETPEVEITPAPVEASPLTIQSNQPDMSTNNTLPVPGTPMTAEMSTSEDTPAIIQSQVEMASVLPITTTPDMPEETVQHFTLDEGFWGIFPHEFDHVQLTPIHLEELISCSRPVCNTESLGLSNEKLANILKYSSGPGQLSRNILFNSFTLAELFNRNADGKVFTSRGTKKGPLNRQKMAQLIEIVKTHYTQHGVEKTIRNAINTALRHLWGRKLKLSWLTF